MGEILEIQVSKGLTKHTGEKEWLKIEYSLKAKVDNAEKLHVCKAQLESIVDTWLKQAFQPRAEQQTGKAKLESRWDPNKIKWQHAEGSSGAYERSEDVNNPEFKAMLKDLAEHSGRLTRNGYFYWTFKNGSVVGRKKKQ